MRNKRFARVAFVSSATITLALLSASPAQATEADPLSAVEKATPWTVNSSADVPTSNSGTYAIEAVVADTTVSVPVDPSDGISASGTGGSVSISLPFASKADHANVEKPGVVSFDNNNGSSTVPVVTNSGSIQINTVLADASAPKRYSYELSVPIGGRIDAANGGYLILNSQGAPVAEIAPPWAKDANGAAVATRYELSGTTLTQVVQPTAHSAYPIVADPSILFQFWGYEIHYTKAETNRASGQGGGAVAVMSVLCSFVPGGAPAAACIAASNLWGQVILGPLYSAANHGKCVVLNQPYVPIPPWLTEVSC